MPRQIIKDMATHEVATEINKTLLEVATDLSRAGKQPIDKNLGRVGISLQRITIVECVGQSWTSVPGFGKRLLNLWLSPLDLFLESAFVVS